ncbi:hypothetical protein Tco_0976493 [Tanacetum coccineum]|uniref:MAK10-like protein n=1 Tax=Tanacetum coccineum TaxID=301880 RepID=A0ABQ5EHH9_9ASTR
MRKRELEIKESKKTKSSIEEDDLLQPWVCEEKDPFTSQNRYFDFPKKTRMPSNVKTYDGSEDPEDHLKIFQAAAKDVDLSGVASCDEYAWHGYRGIGLWEMVWGEQGSVLGWWFGLETMGEGGVVLAVTGLRYRVGCNGLKRNRDQAFPSTFNRRLIEVENQVQRLMEAHLAPTQPTQVNKITTSCEICSGPYDTQYCMEDPEQAFVEYASLRTDEVGGKWFQPNGLIPNSSFNNNPRSFNNQSNLEGLVSNFMASQDAILSNFEADFKQQQSEMTNKIDTVLKGITDRIVGTLPSDTARNPKLSTYPVLSARSYPTEDLQCSTQTHASINVITIHTEQQSASYYNREKKNKKEEYNPENIHVDPLTPPDPSVKFITEKVLKFNSFFESLGLVPPSSNTELNCTKDEDGDVMFFEIIPKDDNSRKEEPEVEGQEVEYFDIFPTRSKLAYHKYLMCGPIPSIFLRTPIIMEGCPSNLKIPCNIWHVHVEKAYIDLNSPLNIMTRMMYNWIMRRKLDPRENANGGVSNFTGWIKGMHVFVGNFTYIVDFMIIEDISSIIDPRLSQVVLGKPFVEISNMTHDPPEGVVWFTNGFNEVAYKMPYKIEQYDSLSDLEKEHTKSVYLRNEEDKRRGVEYVMSKILGFYKECLELGPEYLTTMDDEGEVT